MNNEQFLFSEEEFKNAKSKDKLPIKYLSYLRQVYHIRSGLSSLNKFMKRFNIERDKTKKFQ